MSLIKVVFTVLSGDVVICKSPSDPQMNICKRVVAMEGEYIGFKHCEDGRSHYVVIRLCRQTFAFSKLGMIIAMIFDMLPAK